MTTAEIKVFNGYPTIFINDEPYPFSQSATIRSYNYVEGKDKVVIDEEYIENLGKSGIKLFYVTCDTEYCEKDALTNFNRICTTILRCVKDAYFVVRLGLHPSTDFVKENPNECFTYNDNSCPSVILGNETFYKEYDHLYSECSSVWREKMARELVYTCNKIDELPFSDRVVGYFFAAGGTSEWYYLLDLEKDGKYGDFSLAFKREYSQILKEKYKTESNLKKAWRDDSATFENPKIPNMQERFFAKEFDAFYGREDEVSDEYLCKIFSNGTNVGSFLDVDKNLCAFDFYRAWHLATARSQVYFAKIIKELYNGAKLTGAFYGSYGCTDFFNGSTAGGVLHILDSNYIDFLAAPGVYVNRQLGGFTGQREMADSFTLRNKFFIVEEDTRTHLDSSHYQAMFDCYTVKDSINVLKRDFGRNLSNNLLFWLYDHKVGGGRFKCNEIYHLFSRQSEILNGSLQLKNKNKGNEVALVFDEESIHLISDRSTKEIIEYFRNYELAKLGFGVDEYYHNDLENENMPDYKLYVFFNTFSLSGKEREIIHKKLSKNHAVAMWVYASGVIDFDCEKRFSSDNVKQLTKMNVKILNEKHHTKFRIDKNSEIFKGLSSTAIYGFNNRPVNNNILMVIKNVLTFVAPLFYVDDADAKTVATFQTNGLPAISIKGQKDFTSIFYSSKILNADILREIARYSGCHIWCESDDVVYVSDNYLTIHASFDGEKVINLKYPCSPYEVYEEKFYGNNIRSLRLKMEKGQTLTFDLTNR